jgi:hypothetical protein
MLESSAVTDPIPICQGDVLEWLESRDDSYAIVVTADCDIANDKYGDYLSYVPAIPLRSYIADMYLKDQLLKEASKLTTQMYEFVRGLQTIGRPDVSRPLSSDAIEGWLASTTVPDVLKILNIGDTSAEQKLTNMLLMRQRLQDPPVTDTEIIELLSEARGAKRRNIHRQIHDHLIRLPGDKLYMSTVDGGSNCSGFIVLLRRLREIAAEDIAIRPTQTPAARAKRVARLTSPYRYRLTQQLADIFASIGLPREYETARLNLLNATYDLT